MAEAGSFADRVKQQADIVRVVGEYVRLKKSGQNFSGLCPFHSEKTPSFAVHPVKQIYHCFGCGVGGDVSTDGWHAVKVNRINANCAGQDSFFTSQLDGDMASSLRGPSRC